MSFTALEVERLRRDTPGVATVTHLNNAGSSLMPTPVHDAILRYLDHELHTGGYETAEHFASEIDGVYRSIAAMVNADPSEIAIADCATRAWDMAFYGVGLGEGDRILTTTTEYVSNWGAYLHLRDTKGVEVGIVPDTPEGDIDVEALEGMIDGSVKLITINHVPTHCAVVNPAAEVGAVARRNGIPYLLDACQSVGHLPVDVAEIGCDMMSTTSRKFLRGPRGEGFLFVRSDFLDRLPPVFIELHNTVAVYPDSYTVRPGAKRYETWEKNFANVVGMGAAVDYALELGMDRIWDRIRTLAASARERLAEVPGVTLHDKGSVKGSIVMFSVEGRDPEQVKERLAEQRINVSTSTTQSAPIDMHRRGLESLVRSSFHVYNTDDDIEILTDAVLAISGSS